MPLCDELIVSYRLTDGLDERAIGAALDLLSPGERRRYERFRFHRDRRDFAAAHALLRCELSAHASYSPHEWTFVAGPHGKPALDAEAAARTRLSFNLAHTDGLVACVVARDADVGVDVEAIDRHGDARQLARRYFSELEIEQLDRCSDAERQTRFIEIWTLKEAYLKATGDGLARALHEFAFVFDGPASLRFESIRGVEPETWRFALFAPSSGHRLAVAIRDESQRDASQRARPIIVRPDANGGLAPCRTNTSPPFVPA